MGDGDGVMGDGVMRDGVMGDGRWGDGDGDWCFMQAILFL